MSKAASKCCMISNLPIHLLFHIHLAAEKLTFWKQAFPFPSPAGPNWRSDYWKSTLECTSNQAKNLPLTINLNSLILWQQFFRNICFLSKHRLRNVKKANRLKDFDLPREIVYVVIQIGLAIHFISRVEFLKWILFCDHLYQKQKRIFLRNQWWWNSKKLWFESQRISKIAELDEKYYYAQSRSRYYYYR